MLGIANYMDDFLAYYERAKILNHRNMGILPADQISGCPLQDQIPIYDTIYRNWAGFSKVLEDLWKGPNGIHAGKKKSQRSYMGVLSLQAWLYVFLVHRCTGSGASFEKDHGYRNSITIPMVEDSMLQDKYEGRMNRMIDFVKNHPGPMFTSIGNQPPPFNKPTAPYTKAGKQYLCEMAPQLAADLDKWLDQYQIKTIREVMDFVLKWHIDRGMKRYVFVLTAFVMDIAEYFPHLVDPTSHVYLGANAQKAMDLIFVQEGDKIPRAAWLDDGMQWLCTITKNPYPMSVEDVLCDFIRYKENYVPDCYKAEGKDPLRLLLVMDQERQKSKAEMMPTLKAILETRKKCYTSDHRYIKKKDRI